MARYIDAEEIIQEVERVIDSNARNLDISPTTKEIYLLGMKHTLDFVKVTPPIDAVKVVRCKDCKHYISPDRGHSYCLMMSNTQEGEYYTSCHDHYCSYGERKKNNEQLQTR